MKIISHRGNLLGPNPALENCPEYIEQAIDQGYDCEIDVWYLDGSWYLGHDTPDYLIDVEFLKQSALWCHAKNISAVEHMLANNIHCFWHQGDDVTITSKGYIWTHSNTGYYTPKSIACWIDGTGTCPTGVFAVCTDYVKKV